jgi:hypothetical protein
LQLPSDVTANAANIAINGPGAHFDNGAGTNGLLVLNADLATGMLTLGAGGSLTLTGSLVNAGTVDVASGSTLSEIGAYSQTGGVTTVDGTLKVALVNLNGGTLDGTGLVQAEVTNAAVVSPGDAPGTLTIQGDYTQTAAGTISLTLDTPANGRLTVTGTVTLDGTLAVVVADGFVPPLTTPITLLAFGQRADGTDFATQTGLGVADEEFPTLAYSSASLTLTESSYVLTATAVPLTPLSPSLTFSGPVATFTDSYPNDTPANFTVAINWGDGTPVDTTSGVITFANGVYTVQGSHSFGSPIGGSNVLPLTVTIASLTAPGVLGIAVNQASLGKVSGTVFDDANADGLLETGELGLAGRHVFLDLNHNGILDPGEPVEVTDAKGNYAFTNLIPGTYTLELAALPNDSATSASGVFLPIKVTAGSLISGQNFGVLDSFSPLPVSTSPTPFGTNNPDVATATVHGLYVQILGRVPDANGLTFWVNALTHGVFTSSQIASELLHSAEYDGNEVQSLYRSILGRAPATTEVSFWVGKMQAGLDATGLALAFLNSGEFNTAHATNASFVQAAYIDLFGREVDMVGLAYWTQQLNSGTSRSSVAGAFMNSDELYERAVDNFYEDFFGRAGDSFGLGTWVDELQAGQVTLTEVALAFLGSSEFQSRAALTVPKP